MRTLFQRIWPWVAAALSGVILTFCYPGWNLEGLVWVWPFPLLIALWYSEPKPGKKRGWRGFRLGYVAGVFFFTINLSWLHENDLVPTFGNLALQFFLALYFGAWGAFAATFGRLTDDSLSTSTDSPLIRRLWESSSANLRCAAINACAWTGLEWLRGWLFTGFGWNGLGVAFHQNLILAQMADIVGVTGLSFLIMFCSCIGMGTLRRLRLEIGRNLRMRPHFDFIIAIVLVIVCFFYGVQRSITERPGTENIPVSTLLVQGNIPQDQKWDADFIDQNYQKYADLTRLTLDSRDYDLVVWPESSILYGFYEGYHYNQPFIDSLLAGKDFTFIAGINEDAIDEGLFNTMYFFRGSMDNYANYRKSHLVPFGEFMPFRSFPGVDALASKVMQFDFSPGTSTEPIRLAKPEIDVIPCICFEDTIGRLTRQFVRPGPQLIVNITNDGWFGETASAEQHVANARFRCIELRRPMVRAANTGVTCIIDIAGRTVDHHKLTDPVTNSIFIDGFLASTVQVPKSGVITFYARFGDAFSLAAGLVALLFIAVTVFKRKSPKGVPSISP